MGQSEKVLLALGAQGQGLPLTRLWVLFEVGTAADLRCVGEPCATTAAAALLVCKKPGWELDHLTSPLAVHLISCSSIALSTWYAPPSDIWHSHRHMAHAPPPNSRHVPPPGSWHVPPPDSWDVPPPDSWHVAMPLSCGRPCNKADRQRPSTSPSARVRLPLLQGPPSRTAYTAWT